MKAYIKAISYYLPERIVTNEELLQEFPEWSVDKVAAKVGVNTRHLAASDETAGDMAEKAARKLFAEYGIKVGEKINSIDVDRTESLVLLNSDKISWITINIEKK